MGRYGFKWLSFFCASERTMSNDPRRQVGWSDLFAVVVKQALCCKLLVLVKRHKLDVIYNEERDDKKDEKRHEKREKRKRQYLDSEPRM